MTFWDQAFDTPHFKYGTAPNAFVRAQAHRLRPAARVLVPGDGEGRNGVWLAAQGHAVLSVDASGVGLRKARQLAAEQGVALQTELADLTSWQPAPGAFDGVVLTFVHLPSALRRDVHQRLVRALRPGGWLILEAFTPEQLCYASGGPKDADMLYTLDDLRADFAGLHEHLAWAGEVWLDEGPGHQGPAQVVRYLAQALGGRA
ncbi:MAG: class I SAM-dependent methyltransferase [Alicycliphilus sp.]|jgi:SAM-dependent methyltransferase|nr:MAG: class I SAM-dependent methyltransferase [Alicycliphilus sp.]